MAKKRKSSHRHDRPDKRRTFNLPRLPGRQIANQVIAALYLSEEPLSINDIVAACTLPRSSKELVGEALEILSSEGMVYRSGKKHYALGKNCPLAEATVEKNPRGFGFAVNLRSRSGIQPPKDPFIAAARMGSAQHGDRVLTLLSSGRKAQRTEAEVISILERTVKRLAGFYHAGRKLDIVQPEDPRFPFDIELVARPQQAIADGDAVIVRLLETREAAGPLRGEIIEVLGNPASIDVQFALVIEKFSLPHRFSPEAEKQAGQNDPWPGIAEREDLRHIEHITIDGEDARDFDDAIAVEKTRNGYRLYVSIADVGAYIKPGGTLDREAYERGTSVYFPGRVIPMLPENLSNNLCSLLPDVDRLTVSAILDFDRTADLKSSRYARSVIRSRRRFTYTMVEQIVVEKDPVVRSDCKAHLTALKHAAELAGAMQARRRKRGAIGFTIPEADIRLGPEGRVESITKAKRTFAHQIVEQFMLSANEAVAETFSKHNLPLLYRIHEEPDPEKVAQFITFSATLGISLPRDLKTPAWYSEVITAVAGKPQEYIVNNLLLRTMQQARYRPENVGHFGLAAQDYCHFTSPIRRYPDLIVHRLLCSLIAGGKGSAMKNAAFSPTASLQEDGQHLSARERTAVSSERDMAERLKRQFMSERIGETFRAVISGVNDNFFFVELLDTFISGSVALSTLTDDYYLLDEKHHRLIGDVSGRILQIGNVVEVVLLDVDHHQNRIHFALKE